MAVSTAPRARTHDAWMRTCLLLTVLLGVGCTTTIEPTQHAEGWWSPLTECGCGWTGGPVDGYDSALVATGRAVWKWPRGPQNAHDPDLYRFRLDAVWRADTLDVEIEVEQPEGCFRGFDVGEAYLLSLRHIEPHGRYVAGVCSRTAPVHLVEPETWNRLGPGFRVDSQLGSERAGVHALLGGVTGGLVASIFALLLRRRSEAKTRGM